MSGLVIDLFAGGGGASIGIEAAIGRPVDVAINHDAEAIRMHEVNHPESKHYHCDIWEVDPLEATGGKPVDLLWASPDCTFFSKARGAKPFRDTKFANRRRVGGEAHRYHLFRCEPGGKGLGNPSAEG